MDGVQLPKARATSRRQFSLYHQVPRNSWYSFYQPRKDERLELILEPPSGFEHGIPGLEIQRLNVCLTKGETLATSALSRNFPFNILLIALVNGVLEIFADNWTNLGGISSIPVDFSWSVFYELTVSNKSTICWKQLILNKCTNYLLFQKFSIFCISTLFWRIQSDHLRICFGFSLLLFRSRIFKIVHMENYYPVLLHWEQSSQGKYVSGPLLDQLFYFEGYLCLSSLSSHFQCYRTWQPSVIINQVSLLTKIYDVFKGWKIISVFPGVPMGDWHVSLKNGLNFQWNF